MIIRSFCDETLPKSMGGSLLAERIVQLLKEFDLLGIFQKNYLSVSGVRYFLPALMVQLKGQS